MLSQSEFLCQMVEKYPEFWNHIMADHIEYRMFDRGHDFLHAVIVAQYAILIAPDENTGRLAWFAGMLHNTDHIMGRSHIDTICLKVSAYLRHIGLTEKEEAIILNAVLNHWHLNDDSDTPVLITLKDADRLGNIGPLFPSRSQQHMREVHGVGIPPIDPRFITRKDDLSSYGRNKTDVDNIQSCLEWEPMIRLEEAKKISKPMFYLLRKMLEMEKYRLDETGILANADLLGPYFDEAYTHQKKK